MSGSTKAMLAVTVLQGVNCALYLRHLSEDPSDGRIAIMTLTLVAFLFCLHVLVKGVKLDRRMGV